MLPSSIACFIVNPEKDTMRATPLGAGFVDIFIGQIHSESDDQIQYIIYQIDDNDLLDYSV